MLTCAMQPMRCALVPATGPADPLQDEEPHPGQQPIPRGVLALTAGPQFGAFVAQWNALPRRVRAHLTVAVEARKLGAEPGVCCAGVSSLVAPLTLPVSAPAVGHAQGMLCPLLDLQQTASLLGCASAPRGTLMHPTGWFAASCHSKRALAGQRTAASSNAVARCCIRPG